ncbi:uncharacterized protein LOC124651118 isoform X2 [Lolium rigidum]|uniref:uncharacterized protein LOC124651118 isoform X2 n=1 Tax=Lolium rigidum TaxID=89674 RepID=UPI001F5D1C75|nr:uncharacterized protein LOC124651118 isoform X2 [Lolium rigidum]
MVGGQKKTGQGRMDAAIDHFAQMGYNKADVRKVVNNLIKNVYGDKGWPFLEESGYLVVQEALFEKQEQDEKLQLQLVQEEHQVEVQQQEGAMMGAPPESDMPIVKVHNELHCHIRQLQEAVAQGFPAMDGSVSLRVTQTMKSFLQVDNSRCMSQLQDETFLKGSGQVGGM